MKKKNIKILIWSYGAFFRRKILSVLILNKIIIEKIFTKKNIKSKKLNIVSSEKSFFENNQSKFVYINSAQSMHFKNISKCLENNLNVICEKTLCSNYQQTKKVINLANKKKLKLITSSYFIHHPAFKKIKKLIKNKRLGKIKLCISGFSFKNNFKLDKSYRKNPNLGGSAILDLGFYPLSLEFFLFKNFNKDIIYSNISKSKKLKIDISGNVILKDNDFYRYYFWSYNKSYQNFLKIVFENGEIYMEFIFSKNVNTVFLKCIINNKKKIYEFKNFNQEKIAFKSYLEKKVSLNYNESLDLAKLIDEIKKNK